MYADKSIGVLSGGQQQRAFLARALMQNAQIYFLDEPFAGVDITTEKIIITLFKKLRDEGKTIIVVHHDHRAPHASYYTVLRRVPRRVQLARFSGGGAASSAAARAFTDAAYMST